NNEPEGYAVDPVFTMVPWHVAIRRRGPAKTLRRFFRRGRELQPPAFLAGFHPSQPYPPPLIRQEIGRPRAPPPQQKGGELDAEALRIRAGVRRPRDRVAEEARGRTDDG